MCGIAGVVNCGDTQTLARMMKVQEHRGPDDSGIWEKRFPEDYYIGLASRRLAILDLSNTGHMPMSNEDGSVWITYNGEIYNFLELRQELLSKGHRFTSRTDTEVIVHLYEEEGSECVKRLDGMFAFAICDLRSATPTLFVARDHFGIKPFYYVQRGRRLAFASEIKALLQVPGIEAEIDINALQQYLSLLWVPDPDTIFRGIHKLPAGHCGLFQKGQWSVSKYWDLEFPAQDARYPGSEPDLIEEIRQRFRQSVKSQMISDVPVGAFLSAGLDSSSIVANMARESSQPLRTYTITFPETYRVGERTLDNPLVAERFAKSLGCEHETIVVEPDVAELLPQLIWHMDEPTADPAIITAFLVCREARKKTTVLLSGVGGDELFAGYRKYSAHYWGEMYHKVPALLRREFIEPLLGHTPSLRGTPLKGFVRLAKKMARSGSLSSIERFLMNCTYMNASQQKSLLAPAVAASLEGRDPYERHRSFFKRVDHADFLNQMLYLDTKIFMTSLNLNYADKMSMASSVEVRVPFLDRGLAEFAARSVSPREKLHGTFRPTTKHILRKAMGDMLPAEVLQQPKAGFGAPVDYWLANELRPMVDDLLSASRLRDRGIFQPEAVRSLVQQHRSGVQDWSMQIWQLLTLEVWMEQFIDKTVKSVHSSEAVSGKLA
ncbi:MAG: asparagine synthase (glutamine-hydrolyzing) [Candidatus Sulfotelmatobacter sp.]